MGCMRMATGSHLNGELAVSETRNDPSLLLRAGQVVHVDETSLDIEPVPLRAGQFSLHHTLTLHCSGPNQTESRRIGFGISYIPTRCRCIATQRVNATLVRGDDRYGHFDLEATPQATSVQDNERQHAASVQRWNAMRAQIKAAMN